MYHYLIALLIFIFTANSAQAFSIGWFKSGSVSAPRYFTLEDLKTNMRNYRGYFSFDNSLSPPFVAYLPSKAPDGYPSFVCSMRIYRIRASGGYQFINFPMTDPRIQNGDIVFIRGADPASQVVRFFSTWTHVGMVYNKDAGTTFESLPGRGVNTYNYTETWNKVLSYAVKSVNISDPMRAVNRAHLLYLQKPYLPPLVNVTSGADYFIKKWSDKWDADSMYCSKLAWQTFVNYGVDLDSNRTSSNHYSHCEEEQTDYGMINWNAWIGVSPDDIYYSRNVGPDKIINGERWLYEPLADSIF